MTRDELLASLLTERYTSPWWKTAKRPGDEDSETTQARRRRQMVADWERVEAAG